MIRNLRQVEHCPYSEDTFLPTSWMCMKQTCVSHSSTGAEIFLFMQDCDLLDWIIEVLHSG